MAASSQITDTRLLTEKALNNLTINRVVAQTVDGVETKFQIAISHSDSQYLIDGSGTKTRVVNQAVNFGNFALTDEQVVALLGTPVGKTTLGEILLAEVDKLIAAETAPKD